MPLVDNIAMDIPIAGIQGMTTIDFPGHISAVLFTAGCPWNCSYCQNSSLRASSPDNLVSPDELCSFLRSRTGYLDGIVISGGEPTIHRTLPDLLGTIRTMGYKTALHTNGMYPEMIKKLFARGLVDYVALDVKGPPRAYRQITGSQTACLAVSRSIDYILESGVAYEFRTTYHPHIISELELEKTIRILAGLGCRKYYIQRFRKEGVQDEELTRIEVPSIPPETIRLGEKLIPEFGIR